MYKVLQIGGKDYKLEYSIEASLYADCTASLTGLMAEIQIAGDSKDIKRIVSELSNIPQTTLTIFMPALWSIMACIRMVMDLFQISRRQNI